MARFGQGGAAGVGGGAVSFHGYALLLGWPEGLALAPVLLVLTVLLERRAGAGAARPSAYVWRGLVVAALSVALARPFISRGGALPLVVLVDRSASVAPGAVDDALSVLAFPRRGVAVLPFGDAAGSPLADALGRATRALPGGGRALVLSDGEATGADPVDAAARAALEGVRVDTWAVPSRSGPDAAVTALDVPSTWRVGDELPLSVSLRATAPLTGMLMLYVDDRIATRVPATLSPGLTALRMAYVAGGPGDLTFRVELEVPGDMEPGNNVAYGVSHVAPPPRVLVVGDGPDAVRLADALVGQGLESTVLAPVRFPARLSAIDPWDALILVDVPASAMGLDQLAAVQAFVADLGRGVVLTGGRQSYLPGGWENTPLEVLAPVRLEPPVRGERDAVALLLMIDQSASMGGGEGGAISKLDLAREAAILATEVLHPGDQVGVIAYDDEARWLVPLSTVGAGRELAQAEQHISLLVPGGGTRILRALELGLPALARTAEPTRHAILLTDGRDFNPDRARYDTLVRQARESQVTLSTIAIGFDADRELLMRLAQRGRGRYHSAEDPGDLPRLAVQESEIVRARVEQRGDFRVVASSGKHPVLAGLDVALLPALAGYLAVTGRPGADVALEAPNGDPLLATWNFGLGRVAAWMSDAGEAWAASWSDAEEARFWARLGRYVSRSPEARPPGVTVTVEGNRARIQVDARDASGWAVDLASVSVVVTGTRGAVTYALPQSAPGRYGAVIPALEPGAFPAAVRLESDDRTSWAVPAGWTVGYPAELMLPRDGPALMAAIAEAGGGMELDGPSLALPSVQRERRELWPWLIALAALLWPVEVARQTRLLG